MLRRFRCVQTEPQTLLTYSGRKILFVRSVFEGWAVQFSMTDPQQVVNKTIRDHATANGSEQRKLSNTVKSATTRKLLPPSSLFSAFVRGLAGLIAFVVVATCCYITIPFRAVHGLMKSVGFGNYLPTDLAQVIYSILFKLLICHHFYSALRISAHHLFCWHQCNCGEGPANE